MPIRFVPSTNLAVEYGGPATAPIQLVAKRQLDDDVEVYVSVQLTEAGALHLRDALAQIRSNGILAGGRTHDELLLNGHDEVLIDASAIDGDSELRITGETGSIRTQLDRFAAARFIAALDQVLSHASSFHLQH